MASPVAVSTHYWAHYSSSGHRQKGLLRVTDSHDGPRPAHQIFKVLGPARPGPSQFEIQFEISSIFPRKPDAKGLM